jgi:hypothetical protein
MTWTTRRPPEVERRFCSGAVEDAIERYSAKIRDPEIAWLFANCFPNTLDTTVTQGKVQIKLPRPYAIGYGVIVPRQSESTNLLVPFCVSASHIAFSTIRMEPVFMELGQAAGAAAAIAIDHHTTVQQVPYDLLRKQLLSDGTVLTWEEQR